MSAMSAQVAIVVLGALAADALLRRLARPRLRGLLWTLVLLKLLLPPTLASPVAVVEGPEPWAPATPPIALAAVWLLGALLLGALLATRLRRLRRRFPAAPTPARVERPLRRAARRLGLRRLPRVAVAREARSPAVFGALRPVVVLPEALARDGTPRDLEHVLLHELAHVRRGDLALQALFHAAQVVYWFHPLVWLAARRAHAARELSCDATVAAALGRRAREYRSTLVRLAAPVFGMPFPGGAGIAGSPSLLLQRLRLLQAPAPRPGRIRRAGAVASAAVLALSVLPMGAADPLAAARRAVESARQGGSCLQLRFAVMNLMTLEESKR
jgi:beta-lactamase regulating signal transducer with metallopeptidase domain